jgi:DNA repair protein RadC
MSQNSRVPLHRIALVRERTISYPANEQLRCSTNVATIAATLLHDTDREHFLVFALNNKNRIIGVSNAFVGSLTECTVKVKEVCTYVLLARAASFVVAHNHPSGDTYPSRDDIALTLRLVDCGKLLGVPLLDHIIIAWPAGAENWSYYSLADNDLLHDTHHELP